MKKNIETGDSKMETTSPGNAAAMREALEAMLEHSVSPCSYRKCTPDDCDEFRSCDWRKAVESATAALAAPPRTGKWMNGREYEYEYAYCSECGHMQWADWNCHKQAEDNIEDFANDYRFCPGCGAKMEGGVYVK